jgi:hypothetical protein
VIWKRGWKTKEGFLMMEPKKYQVFIIRENSPAFEVIKKYFTKKRSMKSGRIIPVSDSEFESFQKDFIYLEIDKTGSEKSNSADRDQV